MQGFQHVPKVRAAELLCEKSGQLSCSATRRGRARVAHSVAWLSTLIAASGLGSRRTSTSTGTMRSQDVSTDLRFCAPTLTYGGDDDFFERLLVGVDARARGRRVMGFRVSALYSYLFCHAAQRRFCVWVSQMRFVCAAFRLATMWKRRLEQLVARTRADQTPRLTNQWLGSHTPIVRVVPRQEDVRGAHRPVGGLVWNRYRTRQIRTSIDVDMSKY